MLRFSANLSFLFLDRPFLERFAAASACGFKGVEFHFPYPFPADEVADAARRAGPSGSTSRTARLRVPGPPVQGTHDTAALFIVPASQT